METLSGHSAEASSWCRQNLKRNKAFEKEFLDSEEGVNELLVPSHAPGATLSQKRVSSRRVKWPGQRPASSDDIMHAGASPRDLSVIAMPLQYR
jgi:hypothetical protein